MAGRASIVGAAATHVGKVREHNEDAHFFDADTGLFLVCDGMGGHAAGEVASSIAIQTIRERWSSGDVQSAIDAWVAAGTPEAKKAMLAVVRAGALAAHDAILAEAAADEAKSGMGTTLVGAMIVGNELVFAHAGDSRAYIVRDNIAMQLTEDHTLLSRLLAAGIDVDVSGEGARFRSMLTNALGIGQECKIATFVVPLADGDRFLLCSDGISEYVPEPEVGTVLTSSPSPARAAQKLIELALERGGGDNATAVVIRVLEAGETPQPVELRRKDDAAIQSCGLWENVSPQQRLRALRIAIPREVAASERLPAHMLGERVAWIIIEGTLEKDGKRLGPGALVYPGSLLKDTPAPDRDALAIARSDVRGLLLRADDFFELCDDDPELGEVLHEALGKLVSRRGGVTTQSEADEDIARMPTLDPIPGTDARPARSRAETSELMEPPPPVGPPLPITMPHDDDVVVLTNVKQSVPDLELPAIARTKTPPGAKSRDSVSRVPTPPATPRVQPAELAAPAPTTKPTRPPIPIPKIVPPGAPPATPEGFDLGSELRADLGGDHAVPKRRPSVPPRDAEIEARIPKRPATDLEPEIEAVVELEAEPPPSTPEPADDHDEVEMTVEMTAVEPEEAVVEPAQQDMTIEMEAVEPPEQEMTIEMEAVEPPVVTSTVDDASAPIMTVTVDDEPGDAPITAQDTAVVSGTIKIPADAPRRGRAKTNS